MRRCWTAALLVATLAGCGGSGDDPAQPRASATPERPRDEVPAAGAQGAADIPALVERLAPSVVAIVATAAGGGGGGGSGVVWDDDGHIVTNNHVIEGAGSLAVETSSGERLPARLVASDPQTDLAVVRAANAGLAAATFAETLPRVGSLALAMGSPLGFENTVTAGIVSGLDRSLPTGGPSLVSLIQTDAAISPGNSGGALVGADGEVIGINVAYLPPGETGAVAIGFAIPAPTVRDVVSQLIDDGSVEHSYLGVQLAPAVAGGDTVVIVAAVEPGGPAAAAGLQPRDVLERIDSEDVTAIEDVYGILRERDPGDEISVVVRRGNQEREVRVTLGELPTATGG
jgi:S1-C subfamily serine protease